MSSSASNLTYECGSLSRCCPRRRCKRCQPGGWRRRRRRRRCQPGGAPLPQADSMNMATRSSFSPLGPSILSVSSYLSSPIYRTMRCSTFQQYWNLLFSVSLLWYVTILGCESHSQAGSAILSLLYCLKADSMNENSSPRSPFYYILREMNALFSVDVMLLFQKIFSVSKMIMKPQVDEVVQMMWSVHVDATKTHGGVYTVGRPLQPSIHLFLWAIRMRMMVILWMSLAARF